jgi:long-chain acyl-CoA synthetase
MKNPHSEGFQFPVSTPETVILISFTSGSTGLPKGVILRHKHNVNQIYMNTCYFDFIRQGDVHFSFLPFAHIMEPTITLRNLFYGCNTVYSSGDIMKFESDILIAKPNVFYSVPRILNRFCNAIKAKVTTFPEEMQKLFHLAYEEKKKNLHTLGKIDHEIYDEKVFKNITKSLFGVDKMKFIFSGSAPISQDVMDFYKIVFSCPVVEGYGLTECNGGATRSKSNDNTSGHVGGPNNITELKLIDCPEFNYYTTDKDSNGNECPRGEILIRNLSTFSGYLLNKKETEEVLDKDGFIHTGDIGMFLPNKALKIIDRRKNIFKLSQGEYISPEKVEKVLEKSRFPFQVFVDGSSIETYVVVLITVMPQTLISLSKELKIIYSAETELVDNKEIIKFILADLTRLCKENGLNSLETPRKLLLSDNIFSIENQCLTDTNKMKRPTIRQVFGEKLNSLYLN